MRAFLNDQELRYERKSPQFRENARVKPAKDDAKPKRKKGGKRAP